MDIEQYLRIITNIPAAVGDLLKYLTISPLKDLDSNHIPCKKIKYFFVLFCSKEMKYF